MKEHVAIVVAPFLILSVGCASIRSHRTLSQPTGVTLTAGVGSTLFRLNKTGDLPNAFGGRDIWGGKVDRGFAEVKLLAIDGPILTLATADIDRQSTETVMDRYKPFQNRNAAVAVDVENEINIGPQGSEVAASILKFDTTKQKDLVVGGIKLSILSVQPYNVRYTVQDIMPK